MDCIGGRPLIFVLKEKSALMLFCWDVAELFSDETGLNHSESFPSMVISRSRIHESLDFLQKKINHRTL